MKQADLINIQCSYDNKLFNHFQYDRNVPFINGCATYFDINICHSLHKPLKSTLKLQPTKLILVINSNTHRVLLRCYCCGW